MSSPPIANAPVVFPNGAAQGQDNITGLANNAAKGLGLVGDIVNRTQYFDAFVAPIKIRSGAGITTGGPVSLYLVTAEEVGNWTNGIDPTSASDQSALLPSDNSMLIQRLTIIASATLYYFYEFSVQSRLNGFVPTLWSVVLFNQSGQALDVTNTNFYTKYVLVNYP